MKEYQLDEHGGHMPYKSGPNTEAFPMLGCSHCPASFFDSPSHENHMIEKHSDKPRQEQWESSPGHTVTYIPNMTRHHPNWYILSDNKTGKHLSNMVIGREGDVQAVETDPKKRRQGHATELWHAANEHAETTPGVPTPKHSRQRTRAGDAWAKKVGGDVPAVPRNQLLSARQMRGMIDFENQ